VANLVSSISAWCLAFGIFITARNPSIWNDSSFVLKSAVVLLTALPPLLSGLLIGLVTAHTVKSETGAMAVSFIAASAVMMLLGYNTERLFW